MTRAHTSATRQESKTGPARKPAVEPLEGRLLKTLVTGLPVVAAARARQQQVDTLLAKARVQSVLAVTGTGLIDRSGAVLPTAGTPQLRVRPAALRVAKPAKPPAVTPPSLPGATKIIDLSIGGATGKIAQPLGVNIGSMTAYAQGNSINNLVTQGGGFELGNGRVIVHAVAGSTNGTLVVDGSWMWGTLGYAAAVGQRLVGSTGANAAGAWTITAVRDQLDAAGGATGNVLISVAGTFASLPVSTDTFFVEMIGSASQKLADSVWPSGSGAVARDLSVARGGAASARMTFGPLGAGGLADNFVSLGYYFGADAGAGRNVLQQGHSYQLSFWATTTTAGATAHLSLYQGKNGGMTDVALVADGQWHQYAFTVAATNPVVYENGIASIRVHAANGAVNVDDVKLTDLSDQIAPGNPLSKQVVSLVKEYGFSELRYWHPEFRFARFDDLIGRPEDRPLIVGLNDNYDPQFGLPEMLQLAKETGTEAWITIPTTWTAQEVHNLMEYLGGAATTAYGAKRVADGHAGSWFADLNGIKFEAGNESWNGIFSPNAYVPFAPYFERAQDMFHDFKTDPLYAANAGKLELIVNGWQWVPWYTEQAIAHVPDADAVDVSAYTGGPNTEMPINQLLGGVMSQQVHDNAWQLPSTIFGKKVYVYEEAAGELQGTLSAATESAYATSLGAGLAVARNAMQLTRDYGITDQNLFTMFQRGNNLPNGYALGHFGLFTDLTTAGTNMRPVALAAKLLNRAKGTILASSLTGGWAVDGTSAVGAAATTQAADAMVTFDGANLVVTMFNNTVADLQNTDFHFTLPATIGGKAVTADWSKATFNVLSGPTVASNNETTQTVAIKAGQYSHGTSEVYAALAGHSMGSLVIPLIF
jgi:hypothetical protein